MAQVVSGYSIGPFSFGAESPIGGFLGFASGISSNYATGLNVAVNAPKQAAKVLTGAPIVPADVQALNAAQYKGLDPNPFVQIGQAAGGVLGTGLTVIGVTGGTTAATAGPGIGTGIGAGAAGVGIGVGAAAQTAGPGIGTGIGAGVSGLAQGFGAAVSSSIGGSNTFLLVGAGLILVLLFMTL